MVGGHRACRKLGSPVACRFSPRSHNRFSRPGRFQKGCGFKFILNETNRGQRTNRFLCASVLLLVSATSNGKPKWNGASAPKTNSSQPWSSRCRIHAWWKRSRFGPCPSRPLDLKALSGQAFHHAPLFALTLRSPLCEGLFTTESCQCRGVRLPFAPQINPARCQGGGCFRTKVAAIQSIPFGLVHRLGLVKINCHEMVSRLPFVCLTSSTSPMRVHRGEH